MECREIIQQLKDMSSEKYKANVVKMGIPEENSIGVSTGDIRKLAKKLGRSELPAWELWETGYHEARLLAVLLFDRKTLSEQDMHKLMGDVVSWDLCDHLCKNLIIKRKDYNGFIKEWISSGATYKKRAAFTLMASAAIHDKQITDEVLDDYLRLIQEYSEDEREHVKKAASWALREIGKKNFTCNEKAVILAQEMKTGGGKAQIWIAKDALKELEVLVKVKGRERLISAKSQMAETVQERE